MVDRCVQRGVVGIYDIRTFVYTVESAGSRVFGSSPVPLPARGPRPAEVRKGVVITPPLVVLFSWGADATTGEPPTTYMTWGLKTSEYSSYRSAGRTVLSKYRASRSVESVSRASAGRRRLQGASAADAGWRRRWPRQTKSCQRRTPPSAGPQPRRSVGRN